jgi:hypothetical protein
MKKTLRYISIVSLVSFYPILAFAQESVVCELVERPNFQNLIDYIICMINYAIIPLFFGLAFVMFIWGVIKFVINPSEEVKREQGRQFMLWGVIALTVMVCVWGLVAILANTFGINYVFPQVSPTTPLPVKKP